MVGIYVIRNTDNGKVYIGQSKNISHRRSTHIYDLKNNRHTNSLLQEDYNKNPQSLEFKILCKCEEDDLDMLEKIYIKKYQSNKSEYGYNLQSGGIKGYDCAESTITRLSKSKIGNKSMCGIKLSEEWKKHIAEAQPNRKKVICVETGIVYDSITDASKQTGLNRTKIVAVCTGNRKTTGGYHFKHYDEKGISTFTC